MNLSIVDWFGYNLLPQDRMRFIKEAGKTRITQVNVKLRRMH